MGLPEPRNRLVQRQYLVERPLVGDQAGADQFLAGADQGRLIPGQQMADAGVGVVAQALAIGHRHQEQIQGQSLDRAAK